MTDDDSSKRPTEPAQQAELVSRAQELIDLSGFHRGQIIRAGVELGLFEVVDQAGTSAYEIARELDLDASHTYRLLQALTSLGVLYEQSEQQFSITPLGAVFQTDHPQSLAAPAKFYQSFELVSAFSQLPTLVQEGGVDGFDAAFGMPFYDYTAQHPEFAATYHETMDRVMATETDLVLDALDTYDFSRFSNICDVGGGYGHLLCHLLAAHSNSEGIVFDLPSVIDEANQDTARELGVVDRCTFVCGDMFERVPDADAYFLKHVLDNWAHDECVDILSTIHDAAPPDARVFVVEYLDSPGESDEELALIDIHQLVVLGGGVSTEAELASQMAQAAWELVEVWAPDEGALRVAEGRKT